VNRTIRAIIYDLDGTLVDSIADLHAAVSTMLESLGRPPLSLERVTSFVGNGVGKLVERCLRASGIEDTSLDASALQEFTKHYASSPSKLSRPYPRVAAALSVLRAAGIKQGVCTNKSQGLAEVVLKNLDLQPSIDVVVGGRSGQPLKPDPSPLHECRQLLDVSPAETLYVGDSEVDEETARRAELPFALYLGGYRKKDPADMHTALVFGNYDNLVAWVLGR
jgi:phosphoglycolate phosphatase